MFTYALIISLSESQCVYSNVHKINTISGRAAILPRFVKGEEILFFFFVSFLNVILLWPG